MAGCDEEPVDREVFVLTEKPYYRLRKQLLKTGWVDAAELASQIRAVGVGDMPPELVRHVCDYLEGKATRPRGRPANDVHINRLLYDLKKDLYSRLILWLQLRKKRFGHLEGWSALRDQEWWQGSPSERAARIVSEKYGFGARSWRSLQTELSKKRP